MNCGGMVLRSWQGGRIQRLRFSGRVAPPGVASNALAASGRSAEFLSALPNQNQIIVGAP
eukprot:3125559-Amphidinium_carterae.1